MTGWNKNDIFYIDWYSGNFWSPESFYFNEVITLKQYKNPNELVEYLISKGVSISNKEDALNKIKKYSYYSIINSYKDIFKTSDKHYKKNDEY